MKTIFFVIPKMGRANFILGTDIFQYLKNAGHRLVVFSPFGDSVDFQKKYGGENVLFEPLQSKIQIPRFLINFLLQLRLKLLTIDHPWLKRSMDISRNIMANRPTNPPLSGRLLRFLRMFLSPFRNAISFFFDWLEEIIFRDKNYLQSFDKYQPSAVVLGTWGSDMHDIVFLAHCRRKKVASIVVDLPWSYIDNRMYAQPRKISKVVVWNEFWKKILVEVHKVDPVVIEIAGCARYDYYVNDFKPESKKMFFEKFGADSGKKTITYALTSDAWYPFQTTVIKNILDAIRNKEIPCNCQLIIRLAPGQEKPTDYFELLKSYPELIIEEADKLPNRDHLTNLFKHSDIIITSGSSLILDACVLDKPTFCPGIVDDADDPYNAVMREDYYDYSFFQEAFETRGVSIVWDKKSLISKINAYLENPKLDQDKRAKLVQKFLGNVDGKAGERIATAILKLKS